MTERYRGLNRAVLVSNFNFYDFSHNGRCIKWRPLERYYERDCVPTMDVLVSAMQSEDLVNGSPNPDSVSLITKAWSNAISKFTALHRDVITKRISQRTAPVLLDEVATETKLTDWLVDLLSKHCECNDCGKIHASPGTDVQREENKALTEDAKERILKDTNHSASVIERDFEKAFSSLDQPTQETLAEAVRVKHPDLNDFHSLLAKLSTTQTYLAYPTKLADLCGKARSKSCSMPSAASTAKSADMCDTARRGASPTPSDGSGWVMVEGE